MIKMYKKDKEVVFKAKEIAKWANLVKNSNGSYNISSMLKRVSKADKIKMITITNRVKVMFITVNGLLQVLSTLRKVSQYKKQTVIDALMKKGLISSNNVYVINTVPEIEFLCSLEEVIKPLGLTLQTQYPVNEYRLDGYIKELNLAIEYDELQHSSNQLKDSIRQQVITEELGCKFIRVSINESNNHNVGLVIRRIIQMNS